MQKGWRAALRLPPQHRTHGGCGLAGWRAGGYCGGRGRLLGGLAGAGEDLVAVVVVKDGNVFDALAGDARCLRCLS